MSASDQHEGKARGRRGSRGSRRVLWLLGAGAALAACAAAFLLPWLFDYYTDGFTIRQPRREAAVRSILWEEPAPIAGPIRVPVETYEPAFSADGLTMVFVRGKAKQNADLFAAQWDGRSFGEPEPLLAINTEADELGPELSRDGRYLYFYSNRAGGIGGYDIWVSRRGPEGWMHPENLGPAVNSEFNEYGPGLAPGGRRLFFSSNRLDRPLTAAEKEAWQATLRENFLSSDYDIFTADADEDARFAEARRLAILNSPFDEGQVSVTPRGDFVYFSSNRWGGLGAFDVYRSRVLYGELTEPENMGAPVNSARDDMDPALILEGHGLVLSSNRLAGEGAGPFQLFRTVSREVITEKDYSALAALLRLLDNLKWLLLVLLLGLLLLLALLRYLLSQRFRMYASLLQKCLLASLVLHLLLAVLFSGWVVATGLYDLSGDTLGEMFIDADALAGDRIGLDIREQVAELEAVQVAALDAADFDDRAAILAALPAAELVALETAGFEPEAFEPDVAPEGFAAEPAAAGLDLPDARTLDALAQAAALDPFQAADIGMRLELPEKIAGAAPAEPAPLDEPHIPQAAARNPGSTSAPLDLDPLASRPVGSTGRAGLAASDDVARVPAESAVAAPDRGAAASPLREPSLPRTTAAALPLDPPRAPLLERKMEAFEKTVAADEPPAPSERSTAGPVPLEIETARPAAAPLPFAALAPAPGGAAGPASSGAPGPRTDRDQPDRLPAATADLPDRPEVARAEEPADRFVHGTPRTYHGLEMESRKVVFCLDVSGSMEWNNRIGEARQELLRLLDTLDENVEFNIITFSGGVRLWSRQGVLPGTPENIQSAKRFVSRAPIGSDGTNTAGALAAALADGRVETVYFLSDGHPTVGATNPALILQFVRELQEGRNVVIHTIAYVKGDPPPAWRSDVPAKRQLIGLMKLLADQNHGNAVVFE